MFQFTPTTGLLDTATYPATPANETAARQQFMDLFNQLRDEANRPTLSAAAYAQYNRLINGGFAVNQRGVSGTVTLAANQYGHDRWKAGASGCTYTFATVNNVTTLTITAGSLVQVIEGNALLSGMHTLSWTGTAQGKIGAGSYGASGITGTATGGANLSVEFSAGTLSKVQFNPGDQALMFQPRSFAEELQLCQRYYEKSYDVGTVPGTVSATGRIGHYTATTGLFNNGSKFSTRFSVRKRIAPTVFLYGDGTGTVNRVCNESVVDRTAFATDVGNAGFAMQYSDATASNGVFFHYTADAEL